MKRKALFTIMLCLLSGLFLCAGAYHAAAEDGVKVITAFALSEDDYAAYTGKPALEDLLSSMPAEAEAYLEGEQETVTIPVTWESEQDYTGSDENYYLFYAAWDESEYTLSDDFDTEDYIPFYEVEILGDEEDYSVLTEEEADMLTGENADIMLLSEADTASEGIANIVSRAYHMVDISWTPLTTVKGYINSSGIQTATHYAGVTYIGLPYGQQVTSGRYVPHNASFATFVKAVKNSDSLFYTSRGKYGTKNSLYYANDCSAFVSYCYGLPRMTTSTIANSAKFSTVSGNSIYNAKVGDCFNKSGAHVELITDMIYDDSGNLTAVEVSEQTPPQARSRVMTPEEVQTIIDRGYTLLRYKSRNSVEAPDHYTGCYDQNSVKAGTGVTVKAGDSEVSTTLTWDAYSKAVRYELKLWKGTYLQGAPDYVEDELTKTTCTLDLPVGSYEGYVDSIACKDGVSYYSTCNRQYVKFTVNEHNYEVTKVLTAATCTTEGSQVMTCSTCGDRITETVPALGHTYDSVVTKAATYYETGIRTDTCQVCGDVVTSEIPKLTIAITTQPASKTVTEGKKIRFTIKALGKGLSYQWQYRKSASSSWVTSTATSAKTASYTYSSDAKLARSGYQFRCRLKDSAGHTLYSNIAKLTVKPAISITTQPKSVSVKAGSVVRFTVKATGSGLTYRWQYRKNSSRSWSNSTYASGKTRTYCFSLHIKKAFSGYQVRCRIRDNDGHTKYTNVVKITVN